MLERILHLRIAYEAHHGLYSLARGTCFSQPINSHAIFKRVVTSSLRATSHGAKSIVWHPFMQEQAHPLRIQRTVHPCRYPSSKVSFSRDPTCHSRIRLRRADRFSFWMDCSSIPHSDYWFFLPSVVPPASISWCCRSGQAVGTISPNYFENQLLNLPFWLLRR